MAAAVKLLHGQLQMEQPSGWAQLVHFYGGSAELCLRGFLRATAGKGKQLEPSLAHAQILRTLAFREENQLNRRDGDVLKAIETAPCRGHWPYGFAQAALDGSPVEYCCLSRLSVTRIISDFDEAEVVHFFALWCEHTTRLYGASVRTGAATKGSLHVYDCSGVRWSQLLLDARRHWETISRVFAIGGSHWPDLAARYYVVSAPAAATLLWSIIRPLVGPHVQKKLVFSRGAVPPELASALGGEAATRDETRETRGAEAAHTQGGELSIFEPR